MIADISTIIWKELKELLFQRGNLRGGWIGLAIFMVAFGILIPLQSGPEWVSSPIGLIFWAWLPFLLVSTVVADSFAGERERHTLETLLASRLSDRAILFGKIATAVIYGWGLTIFAILLGLLTVNLAYGRGKLLIYPFDIALSILIISLLVALLSSGVGVLVSLHASTVRQAQQIFSVANLIFFIPLFLIPILPNELKVRLVEALSRNSVSSVVVLIALVLAAIDILLLVIAMRVFQRSRLILD